MIGDWFRFQLGLYFANAGAQRDYRAQMRGAKAPLYWTLYLGLLITAFMIFYGTTWQQGVVSVSQMQSQLQGFYTGLIFMLEIAVGLAAPVLAASSVVAEYQRRSMELLMAAPVTPRYFLMGKLISSYRYVWMLLALSIPLTAACVVMGGTTWAQVLETYFIISLHGLLYAACGLMIAVLSQKPIPAVSYSLLSVGMYFMFMMPLVGSSIFMGMSGLESNPLITMAPGGSIAAAGASINMWGVPVPGWLIGTVATVYLSSVCLLGAGSAMSPFGSPMVKKLRIFGIVTMILLGALLGWLIGPSFGFTGAGEEIAAALVLPTFLLVPILAYTAIWSIYGTRKSGAQSLFHWRNLLRGGSGSALPYLATIFAGLFIGFTSAFMAMGGKFNPEFLSRFAWAGGVWLLLFAIARAASAWNKGEVKTARALFIALLCAFILLPIPILLFTRNVFDDTRGLDNFIALMYPFAAGFSHQPATAFYGGLILVVVAGILLTISEASRKRRGADVGVLS